jgi:uncharacterized protein (DUF2236 family)
MRERAVNLLYGQRSLMIGALQPIAFIGTTQRSKANATPWRRLVHTAHMFDAVFFGTRAEADKALAYTARLHEQVKGTLGEPIGPYAASTSYSAFDPELMVWVTAPMLDSARVLYESFVRRLSAPEREQLYQEYLTFGELFGMPRDAMLPTYEHFRRWWPEALADEGMFLTETARTVGLNIGLRIPMPGPLVPFSRLAGFLILGTLPPIVREKYGLRWRRIDQAAFDAIALGIRSGRWTMPRRIRRGPSGEAYDLIARTESKNLRAGKQSFEPVH